MRTTRLRKEAIGNSSGDEFDEQASDSDIVEADSVTSDGNADGGVASKTKLTRGLVAVKKRKKREEEALALQVTQTHIIPGLLGDVDKKPAAASMKQSTFPVQITRSNVPDGKRILRVTDTAGESKENSRIEFNRDLSTLPRSVAGGGLLQIVLDNIHNCTVSVDCITGSISMNQCNNIAVVLEATSATVELQASHFVSIEVRDAKFPSDGVSYADVSDLSVSITRGKSVKAFCTIDREQRIEDGFQSVIVCDRAGSLAKEMVSLKAKQQQLHSQTRNNSNSDVDKKVKKKARKTVAMENRIHEEVPTTIPDEKTYEEMVKRIGFCCYRCYCPEEKKKITEKDPCIESSNGGLNHRRCCHDAEDFHEEWCTPLEAAKDLAEWNLLNGIAENDVNCYAGGETIIDRAKLKNIFKNAKRCETALHNDESLAGKHLFIHGLH